jgi:dTDP-D-glucose 4,6-dehydratase
MDFGGQYTRAFIFMGDLCRAIRLALEGNVSGEVFQIATRMRKVHHRVGKYERQLDC